MLIRTLDDPESASRAAAGLLVQMATKTVKARGRFSVALAGGSTPKRAYELLSADPYKGLVQWERVHVFFGDERCVPLDDPQSNYRMAREALLDAVGTPASQIHPIRCIGSDEAGALAYEEALRGFFGGAAPRLDLILLGMGEDGHTASLFPGTSVLAERERWVMPVCPPNQDLCRVTLTPPLINQARTIAFLVSGEPKAATLKDVIEGPHDPLRLPSQLIQPSGGELIWIIDRAAASQLSGRGGEGERG